MNQEQQNTGSASANASPQRNDALRSAVPIDGHPTALSGRDRARRHRVRKREGQRLVTVELSQGQLGALASLGWLGKETQYDNATIVRAIHAITANVILNRDHRRRSPLERVYAHLPGTDPEKQEIISAANNARDPDHFVAVEILRTVTERAGIAWSPPRTDANA
jgi:hypothetical protein